MYVNDYMSLAVTAQAEESYLQACTLMQEHAVDHIPIVNESDVVISVLSRHDAKLAASRFNIGPIETSEVATVEPVMIAQNAPLTAAAEVMMARHVEVLVVTDKTGHIVGVLSYHDMQNALLHLLKRTEQNSQLNDYTH